jgi:hypothetical protein
MLGQLEQYWQKLFSDPLIVKTKSGTIVVQPQRTNNVVLPAGFQNPQDPSKTILGRTNRAFAA